MKGVSTWPHANRSVADEPSKHFRSLALASSVAALVSLTSSPRLLAIGVINYEEVNHTTSVRLRKDGETVIKETHELGASVGEESHLWKDGYDWGEVTEYSYAVRVDGGEWTTLDLDMEDLDGDTNCALLLIDVYPFDTDSVIGHLEPRSCDWSVSN